MGCRVSAKKKNSGCRSGRSWFVALIEASGWLPIAGGATPARNQEEERHVRHGDLHPRPR